VPASAIVGSGGPPRPIATITGSMPRRAASRATEPAIAVFPVRFPVPITASVGTDTGGPRSGGSRRKSGPAYGTPATSATAASSIRSR
jgi:hypothetical protein